SKPFKVGHKYIHMLVGGGGHKGGTCVNLVVAGNTVQTATGRNNEKLFPVTWDVGALAGKTATIQIVDNQRGGWGHVNVDHIVFSDKRGSAAAAVAKSDPAVSDAVVGAVARKHGLDAARLKQWIAALGDRSLSSDTSHPLGAWAKLAPIKDAAAFSRTKEQIVKAIAASGKPAPKPAGNVRPLGNFDSGSLDGWFLTGEAFGQMPAGLEWSAASGRLADPGTLHSGLYGKKLQGVARSPTFTLDKDVHLLISGSGVELRLIIDGYQMEPFNGLLFKGTRRKLDTKGKFQWISMTSGLQLGRSAYVEIIDHGDGYFVLDEAWVNGRGTTPRAAPPRELLQAVHRSSHRDRSPLARFLGESWMAGVQRWAKGNTTYGDRRLIGWALRHGLFGADDDGLDSLRKQMQDVERSIPKPQYVFAMTDGTGENEFVHIRGSHKSLGAEVPRRMISAAGGLKQPQIKSGSGRLVLARQVADPENPLTTRVVVNRLWHHLFSRGIAPTVDDFGKMGLAPSHPMLLDWLARDFAANGWSIKKALRSMVLSRTYRMSSRPWSDRSRVDDLDADNALLHRMPIRRLQAEAVRDQVLAISGRLDRKPFGPSVPVYLTSFQGGRGRPRGGPLDGAGRRSIYLAVRRNFVSSLLLTYDFPVPFSTMGRRSVSNVPAQALAMMNDPFVVAEAKRWGETIAKQSGSPEEKITYMFESAFAQKPTDRQLAGIEAYLAGRSDPAAWAEVAHTLFNMKSFIYLN
ncbi:MAG: DUF1553 domain-containing protein, partial [Phycisphaerae bacterium]|nr:DUF1553 domain-containing protein [Phycisphaerae bacterium]